MDQLTELVIDNGTQTLNGCQLPIMPDMVHDISSLIVSLHAAFSMILASHPGPANESLGMRLVYSL